MSFDFKQLGKFVLCSRCLVCGLTLMISFGSCAQTLEKAVQAARQVDSQYAADMAGVQSRRAQARQSGTAYWPYAGVTYTSSDLASGGSGNKVLSLTQPLISYDRYLSVQQADGIGGMADAETRLADQNMILRVFSVMTEIIRQREALRSNQTQINGLEEQLQRAQRMLQLGQGTVTEVGDFEARLATARANRVALQNTFDNATRKFRQLTGMEVDAANMGIDLDTKSVTDKNLSELTAYARQNAVAVQQAQHNVELAQIAAKRVRAQYVPQVYAQLARVKYASYPGTSANQIGISLSATLGAPQYYEEQKASADLLKAQETLRYAQESSVSDVVKLYSSVLALETEVKAREQAIQAARQAVEANVKSYQAGVKSNTDVVASYQNLVDAEMQLTNSLLSKYENILRLKLL